MANELEQSVLKKAQAWLDGHYDEATKKQVKYLMDNDMKELVESFYKDLEFGTGGLRGIKLHPDFQGFALNDRRLLPIFESAQDDFVFEIHIGSDDPLDKAPSSPFMLADLMRSFPRLRVIGAHFGGYQMWDYSLEALGDFENLWIDTSSTTPYVTPSLLQRLLARHSPDRLLFGTDWPLYDPAHELERLRTMSGLSEDAIERILSNAGRLLGIGA